MCLDYVYNLLENGLQTSKSLYRLLTSYLHSIGLINDAKLCRKVNMIKQSLFSSRLTPNAYDHIVSLQNLCSETAVSMDCFRI